MSAPRKIEKNGEPPLVAVSRAWIVALPVVILVPWLIAAVLYFKSGPAAATGVDEERAPASDGARSAASGPWGRLTITPIIVSPPLEYVAADWQRGDGPAEWLFPDTTPEMLASFLSSSGLSTDQLQRLTNGARPEPRIRGIAIRPDLEVVRSMTPEVRARVYGQLAKSSFNFDQAQSFRFFGQSPDAWLKGSLISAETRRLVEPLIYSDGDFLHFADAEVARQSIKDPAELQRLAKVLLRQSTVLAELSIPDARDVPALAQYWGRGGRSTDIRPLLESVAGADNSIDIVHLLPAFARNRLYRYPQLTTGDMAKPNLANCLWSSLNFFRLQPDDRFLELNASLTALREDYYVVQSDFQLGDIVAFVDAEGDLFHVAVYLADDLLFTKNGTSPVSPWTIMPLERVKGYYRTHTDKPRLIYHRRKDL